MKYFSLDTVEKAYKNISANTNNKFWGILAITSSVGSLVHPQRVYSLNIDNVSNLLEKQFCLTENPKEYSRGYFWNVIFSKSWATYISEKLLKDSPNIYDVLIWYFRREGFEDSITTSQLIKIFLEKTNISLEFAKQLFRFDETDLNFSDTKYTETALLTLLNTYCNNSTSYTTITAEKSFVAANAGELSRAPFVQTLYAGQGAQECMILTQFNFHDYYGSIIFPKSVTTPSESIDYTNSVPSTSVADNHYLIALRTKPFMLLAGISGTGKSRIVREFAFKSCPPALQDAEGTTPGNYCMIEVKPNWHDSTEILGYYSNIAEGYQYTKFIKFLVKAMMFPNVPFFVCLDEMNLAPVEQYFAEFLSVLETRKKDKEKKVIQSGVLVAPEYFAPILNADSGNGYIAKYLCPEINVNIPRDIYKNTSLTTIGLTLPDNVFIIGTVNMDDTTHQFSRKVIDRAMTIEMNGGKLEDMFGHSADLQYLPEDQIMELSDFKPEYVNADEVMEAHLEYAEILQEKLVEKLDAINNCLKNTPFQVSYRVLNELCIYAGVLLDDGKEIDTAIADAIDQITLMKILPRIEGDEDMFVTKDGNKLEQLQEILGKDSASGVKLEDMKERLKNSSFTRFWP